MKSLTETCGNFIQQNIFYQLHHILAGLTKKTLIKITLPVICIIL